MTPSLGLVPKAQLTEEPAAVQRHEVALRMERAIGQIAVEDFVTPPPAAFAKGCSTLTFAAYTRSVLLKRTDPRRAAIVHTRTKSTNGCWVEICLFASLENFAGYLAGSAAEAPMWSASSAAIIEEFVAHRGKKKAKVYDDDESIAVEILRTINNQGMADSHVFRRVPSTEWFAEIYLDVELSKDRWHFQWATDLPEPVDRIVIGAPLWIRSSDG